MGLRLGRLQQNQARLFPISVAAVLVHIRRVLAGLVALQGRVRVRRRLNLDAGMVLWGVNRGGLKRLYLSIGGGGRT